MHEGVDIMNDYLTRLGMWLWQLGPANPILVRVVQGGSKRPRHLWLRFGYLAAIVVVVVVVMAGDVGGSASTLGDLAKNASRMFMWASITQLSLMCFLSPIFTAGAITQERDSQTFDILLSTPLSDAQIVLGSLMSRLYFLLVLLFAGLPVFLITMIYGGVTFRQIILSSAIAAATAVITGSLAIAISMIRVGTRRTIFSFYMMIGLYLLAVYAAGRWDGTWVQEASANTDGVKISWLAAFHPFLAMDVALNRVPAPDVALLTSRGTIMRYLIAYPQQAYITIMLGVSTLLTIVAVFFVRRSKESEVGFAGRLVAKFSRHNPDGDERRRKPRKVWKNPVAWREATTRASAVTKGFLQVILLGGGVIVAILMLVDHVQDPDVVTARFRLSVVMSIELSMILLVATNTAATAITKERESDTMELLLTTPLTSQYIVWGKLRGLVTFTLPLIAIPVFSVTLFAIHGLLTDAKNIVVPVESVIETAALMVVYAAAACMFGLYMSLHNRRTVQAVMFSVGTIVVVCLIMTFVGDSIVTSADKLGAFLAPFTPFTGIQTLIDPARVFKGSMTTSLGSEYIAVRIWMATGCGVAIAIYILCIGGAYKSMVRNFDMIVRRQSANVK